MVTSFCLERSLFLSTARGHDQHAQDCQDGVVLHKGKIAHTGSLEACQNWYLANIKDIPEDDALDNEVEEESISSSENNDDNEGLNADLW